MYLLLLYIISVFRYATDQVVSCLEEKDFQRVDTFLLPPEDATRSDEDSAPEDDEGFIENLARNQLCAKPEATVVGSVDEHKHRPYRL